MYFGSAVTRRSGGLGWFLLLGVVAVVVWSRLGAADRLTWWLESLWVLVGIPVTIVIARTHRVTRLLLVLLAFHGVVLLVGARYTYELVPIGEWVQAWIGGARNDFDRFGHFLQGFVPAMIARELLRRTSTVGKGPWLIILCIACALAFSACFEMIEWRASVLLGVAADSYLGSQGDPWDAQWDMFCALMGSIVAMTLLSRRHERELIEDGLARRQG